MTATETFSIFTHNGEITLENTLAGTHRTFRIRTQAQDAEFAPGERILSLLIGSDNESDYQGLGFVKQDRVVLWKKHRTEQIAKLLDVLLHPEIWEPRGVAYHSSGCCRRCNRKLTTPESIEAGIGPICAGKE